MENWNNVEEVLDFAIEREQEAADSYTELADRVERAWMKDVFLGFAEEEKGHKRKLIAIKEGRLKAPATGEVKDLKIGDYLVDVDKDQDGPLSYQDALILAMKKEKAAFRLYSDLAERVQEEELINTFRMLAQEEAKHKLRFELEYDDYVLTDN